MLTDNNDYTLIKKSKYFDIIWYQTTYPDIMDAGIDPIKHYLMHGRQELRRPCKCFNVSIYVKLFLSSENSINPIIHYEKYIKNLYIDETCFLYPSEASEYISQSDYDAVKNSIYFDAEWYHANNNDLYDGKIDPIDHFLTFSTQINLSPSEAFNNSNYIKANLAQKDEILSYSTPLIHYEKVGKYRNFKTSVDKYHCVSSSIFLINNGI